ncbi:MAG: D-tyrosyl-tRNA(Tyr) deacylase [Lentisphaerae bacterium]|nr:D-tyrosyl-tRNA(Tyr) deacylase [Lentisphaerota bacterium]
MKALIQRVTEASVVIDGETVARMGRGLLVLLGIRHEDGEQDVLWLARKLPQLRIFEDDAGAMNRSLEDVGGAVIVVSQFTLYADARHGNRPGFAAAARPGQAEPLYDSLVTHLRARLGPERVGSGRFGAEMQVRLVNDGPVTIELESRGSGTSRA